MPGYIEWILAFPRAPTGSISIQVWWIACASTIVMVGEAVGALYTLRERKWFAGKSGLREQPMAMSSGQKDGPKQQGKKEL